MSLQDFQTAIGRRLLARDATPHPLFDTPGFRLTAKVQRSWSIVRARDGARATLTLLPADQSASLLARWVDRGGGAKSFASSEAVAFLEFIAAELPDPSEVLTICRTEQAVARATPASLDFRPPLEGRMNERNATIGRNPSATLVSFSTGPEPIVARLNDGATAPREGPPVEVLFAPGLANLYRIAEADEAALWRDLDQPRPVADLLKAKHDHRLMEVMLECGALTLDAERRPGQPPSSFSCPGAPGSNPGPRPSS